jgi:hypothetical protein
MRNRHVTQERHAGQIASLFEVLSALRDVAGGVVAASTGLVGGPVASNSA